MSEKSFATNSRFQQQKYRENRFREFYIYVNAQVVWVTSLLFYVKFRFCPRKSQ